MTQNFVKIADLSVTHAFYGDDPVPIRFKPTGDLRPLFLRETQNGIAVLAREPLEGPLPERIFLVLEPESPEIAVVTDVRLRHPESLISCPLSAPGIVEINQTHVFSETELIETLAPGGLILDDQPEGAPPMRDPKMQDLALELKDALHGSIGLVTLSNITLGAPLIAQIHLEAARSHWAYHIITKAEDVLAQFSIKTNSDICFREVENSSMSDGRRDHVFRSTTPIPFAKRQNQNFSLWKEDVEVIPRLPTASPGKAKRKTRLGLEEALETAIFVDLNRGNRSRYEQDHDHRGEPGHRA